MKKVIYAALFCILSTLSYANTTEENSANNKGFYSIKANNIDGEAVSMDQYKGKYVLIVNVASKCGYTKQYDGLEKLYKDYKDSGVIVLGFPCNQFGEQEPGSSEEIANFCRLNYGVSFPMFEKIEVNGSAQHPLYEFLKGEGGEDIKWNFTKFLVSPKGEVIGRYESKVLPSEIGEIINEKL